MKEHLFASLAAEVVAAAIDAAALVRDGDDAAWFQHPLRRQSMCWQERSLGNPTASLPWISLLAFR